MEFAYHIATPSELEEILSFSEAMLAKSESDETQRMFKSWHAPWRREALEHYLKLGWSFTVRDKGDQKLLGFFLGQALLFMRGQTQTLWIEALEAENEEARKGLADVAVRLSREKHLQRVLFQDSKSVEGHLDAFKHNALPDSIIEVFTTKG